MKTVACITIFLSLLMITTTSAVLAQNQSEDQTVDVIGTGRIYRENITTARNQAISDCLVTAVSLATKDLLQQQVFIESFQTINRLLLLKSDTFIQGYKVLTEDSTGRVYRVMVQATVSVDKIREILIQNEILSRNTGPLKVLLLIAEQDLEDILYKYWWGDAFSEIISEAPLAAALAEQGFVVVDHRPVWPTADDFDTSLEIPLELEMIDTRPDMPVGEDDAPLDSDLPWPDTDDPDMIAETTLGTEMSDARVDISTEQDDVLPGYDLPRSDTDDSDTIVETTLTPEMNDTRADISADRDDVPLDYDMPQPGADDSDTLMETTLGAEMNDPRADASIEWKNIPLGSSLPMPDTRDVDTFSEIPLGPEMSNDQAAAFGARFQADVVIVGTATVKKASNVLGDELKSFEGALSVRAVRTDTGVALAEIDHKFITADADDRAGSRRALIETGAQTGELLSWKVQTAWQQTLNTGPTATAIVVEGEFQLPHLVAFRRILSSTQGVSDLKTTEMSPKKTTLSLNYDGDAKELAEALLLKSFKGFGVHITEATQEIIRLSLVSN